MVTCTARGWFYQLHVQRQTFLRFADNVSQIPLIWPPWPSAPGFLRGAGHHMLYYWLRTLPMGKENTMGTGAS